MTSINGNFNNQNLFQKLDTNNDGKVSFKEIKNLFTKGIENKEHTKENGSINTEDKPSVENYKAHESEANSINFDKPQSNKVEGSDGPGDGAWKKATLKEPKIDRQKDINLGASNFSKEALLQKTNNDPNVVALLDKIGNDKKAGHYIEKLFQDNPDKASEICKSLSTYLDSESSPNALVNSNKKLSYVKDLLHDVAYPTDIAQQTKKTCGATAVQVQLAMEDPQKYVELGLSLGDGKSWNGIQPNDSFKGGIFDVRSLSSKVIQNSFMDYANGGESNGIKYGTGVRASGDWSSFNNDDGITNYGISDLQKTIFGNSVKMSAETHSKEEIFSKIDERLKDGDPVAFSVKDHEMLLIPDTSNPEGVYTVFTWGEERKISAADLANYLKTVELTNS
jgi:hypothetical protein